MSAETTAWLFAMALFALATVTFTIADRWIEERLRARTAEARQLEAEDQRDRWKGWHDQRTDERDKLAAELEALRSRVIQAAHVAEHAEGAA